MGPFAARVPSEVREVSPAGRVLAWCRTDPDGLLVLTTKRLRATPTPIEGEGTRRTDILDLAWVDVLGVSWDDPLLELLVLGEGRAVQRRLVLVTAGVVPQVVRERVMQSLLVQQHVPIMGQVGVRFLARRDPDSAEVRWQRVIDEGLDLGDPLVAARVEAAQVELSRAFGV